MNKGYQVGWWLVVLTIIVLNISALPFVLTGSITNEYLLSIIGEITILIPIVIGVIYAKKSGIGIKDTLGIKGFDVKNLPSAITLTLGSQYFIIFATFIIQIILIILFGEDTATSLMPIPKTTGEYIIAFLAVSVAAPVFEELLCRGVIFKLFEKYGIYTTIFASSLAFALLHFEARSFIPVFFVGMIFSIFRMATGSVFITMIMHSVSNFASMCQLVINNDDINNGIMIFFFALAVVFPFLFYKMIKKFGLLNIETKKEKTGISVGMIICILLFIGYNIFVIVTNIMSGEFLKNINI